MDFQFYNKIFNTNQILECFLNKKTIEGILPDFLVEQNPVEIGLFRLGGELHKGRFCEISDIGDFHSYFNNIIKNEIILKKFKIEETDNIIDYNEKSNIYITLDQFQHEVLFSSLINLLTIKNISINFPIYYGNFLSDERIDLNYLNQEQLQQQLYNSPNLRNQFSHLKLNEEREKKNLVIFENSIIGGNGSDYNSSSSSNNNIGSPSSVSSIEKSNFFNIKRGFQIIEKMSGDFSSIASINLLCSSYDFKISIDVCKSYLFQILFAISQFQIEYSILHCDLIAKNTMIKIFKSDSTNLIWNGAMLNKTTYFTYDLFDKTYYIKNLEFIVKIIDFDKSIKYTNKNGQLSGIISKKIYEYSEYIKINFGLDFTKSLSQQIGYDLVYFIFRNFYFVVRNFYFLENNNVIYFHLFKQLLIDLFKLIINKLSIEIPNLINKLNVLNNEKKKIIISINSQYCDDDIKFYGYDDYSQSLIDPVVFELNKHKIEYKNLQSNLEGNKISLNKLINDCNNFNDIEIFIQQDLFNDFIIDDQRPGYYLIPRINCRFLILNPIELIEKTEIFSSYLKNPIDDSDDDDDDDDDDEEETDKVYSDIIFNKFHCKNSVWTEKPTFVKLASIKETKIE